MHAEMGIALCGDLRQVGDAEHLAVLRYFAHHHRHALRHSARYARVDFVEDNRGQVFVAGYQSFQGEHHAGNLAAGGNLADRLHRHVLVGREEEHGCVHAAGGGHFARLEGKLNAHVGHSERVQAFGERLLHDFRRLAARGGKDAALLAQVGELGGAAALAFLQEAFHVFQAVELFLPVFGEGKQVGDACGAVLLQQVVDKVEATRHLFGAGGVEVDALALAFEFVGDVAYFDACAFEAFGERGGFGQVGGDAFEQLRGAAQFGEAFAVAAVDGEGGRAERSLDFLGMFQ